MFGGAWGSTCVCSEKPSARFPRELHRFFLSGPDAMKGRTCAAFERLFLAAWLAPPHDRQDLLLCLACRMAHVYAAYDTPKKNPRPRCMCAPNFFTKLLCHEVVRRFRITSKPTNYLALGVRTDRKRPWICFIEDALVPRDLQPGQVWMPVPHVQLSRAAGCFLRHVLISSHGCRRQCADGILERHAPEELIKLLKHKIAPRFFTKVLCGSAARGRASPHRCCKQSPI